MMNIGVSCQKKKLKISFLIGEEEEEDLKQLLYLTLKMPNRYDISFYRGDFGIVYLIKFFSETDFESVRSQLQEQDCLR